MKGPTGSGKLYPSCRGGLIGGNNYDRFSPCSVRDVISIITCFYLGSLHQPSPHSPPSFILFFLLSTAVYAFTRVLLRRNTIKTPLKFQSFYCGTHICNENRNFFSSALFLPLTLRSTRDSRLITRGRHLSVASYQYRLMPCRF